MKSILLCLLMIIPVFSNASGDIGNDIAAAIRGGNAKQLATWFNNHVDLTVLGKEELYSKAQAEQILRDFFAKHPPKSFILKHHSSNPTSTQYGIGTFLSKKGERFRIHFLIKKIGNQSFIQQFSIETEI
ncbi:MAG: DUF4783 domain-containing protein [Bacteroidia bacterium]